MKTHKLQNDPDELGFLTGLFQMKELFVIESFLPSYEVALTLIEINML